jgi:ABC-2 type transport system ATP-binding protein
MRTDTARSRTPYRNTVGAALLAVVVAGTLAGCSSSSTATPTTTQASTTTCTRGEPSTPVAASRVPGSTTNWDITSFDGTVIRAHWFPLSVYEPSAGTGPHPTILMGPGWSESGDTDTSDTTGQSLLGADAIRTLFDAGYNVLTWDPRGFGASGGQAEVDSPAYEARDVSALVDWVATQPGVELDAPGDPRVGMVGGSYGGGIQLVTAATDCRIDAIVPTIAWNSLTTSLFKSGIVKSGWAGILSDLSSSDHVAPQVVAAQQAGLEDGTISAAQEAWFAARGPAQYLGDIHIPTLILQGTVDTLFTLQEGVDNYEALRARGVPTAMQWFCGGHGVCLTPAGDVDAPEQATLAWLKRYVQRDTSVDTGPGFDFVDQNGTSYTAPAYPVAAGPPVTASGSGSLPLVATGGSGPLVAVPGSQELGTLVAPITPAPASTAVDMPVSFAKPVVVVGAPRLQLTYSGHVAAGDRPERVFAQLVDRRTGDVLGNQVTPIPVVLDGATHSLSIPLEIVAYTAAPTSEVELQLVATTVAYAQPRLDGSVTFSTIRLTLPTAADLTPVVPTTAG